MNQHPDYTTYIKALVLSANDVMATVLLLYEDEGFSPLNICTVSLPDNAQAYRERSKDGKSKFQRGDLITIDCRVTEQKKKVFDEKAIEAFLEMKTEVDEDEAEETERRFGAEAKFAKEWADLEKRDFQKREAVDGDTKK
jgi:hypothetical protein